MHMTVHVQCFIILRVFLVPKVQFTESHYSVRFPNSTIFLCLTYNGTEDGPYVQFNVEVHIRDTAGMYYSQLLCTVILSLTYYSSMSESVP